MASCKSTTERRKLLFQLYKVFAWAEKKLVKSQPSHEHHSNSTLSCACTWCSLYLEITLLSAWRTQLKCYLLGEVSSDHSEVENNAPSSVLSLHILIELTSIGTLIICFNVHLNSALNSFRTKTSLYLFP